MNADESNAGTVDAGDGSAVVPDEGTTNRPSIADIVRAGWPVAVVAGAVCLAYADNIQALLKVWHDDPDYSHGYLVIPIALAILWQRWPASAKPHASWLGWGIVAVTLALRLVLHSRGNTWTENATLVVVIAGLGLARLGGDIFRQVWPGFLYLVFLLPLHPALNASLSLPLQRIATVFSVVLLKATGLWVFAEGNVINVDGEKLQVQEACNGLAMLMSLSATVVAAACLIPMSMLKRIILLVSVIPVALASNIIRISATTWAYHLYGAKVGSEYAHDIAGYLMMPVAMCLVGLELWLVSWIVVEAQDTPEDNRIRTLGGTVPNFAGGPR